MILRYALLGAVQGIAEFLPISSSGHLVFVERLIGIDPPGVLLEALLHAATLAAILVVFRSDIVALGRAFSRHGTLQHRKENGLLIAGTVPIVVAGLALRSSMDAIFSSLTAVSVGFFVTGALLVSSSLVVRRRHEVRFSDALAIGLAQAVSLLPGLSRSGATISIGLFAGLSPQRAARFSFLLAVPALLGAALLNLWGLIQGGLPAGVDGWGYVVATLVAFAVGWASIRALLALVARGRLWGFGVYCIALGVLVLVSQG